MFESTSMEDALLNTYTRQELQAKVTKLFVSSLFIISVKF